MTLPSRRRLVAVAAAILAVIALSGCARGVRPEYSAHPILYCGWLDLREGDYKKAGYNSRAEWKIIIERINIYFLQKSVSDYCGTFKVIGATGKADLPPANSYHVKFNVIQFDGAGTELTVGVKIIDTDSRRVISSFTSRPSGIASFGSVVFMGRMSHMCQNIAKDIASHIYQQ